ncbi:HPr family phosphocarrier protein [uncultured Agathobaculum sp.]|uniref:HPr family phosphocarrier protein n=1 Tax=uncultured Agathobaculum sp. TaxID=2048140 RepID=UPI00320B2B7D
MKTVQYTIKDELGIHARPAGMLVKEAAQFKSSIKIAGPKKEVDAKRIMGVMSMGVKKGDTVKLTIEGADEAEAAATLQKFLQENL